MTQLPRNPQEFLKWYISRNWDTFIELDVAARRIDLWIVDNWEWLSHKCGFVLKSGDNSMGVYINHHNVWYYTPSDDVWQEILRLYDDQTSQ